MPFAPVSDRYPFVLAVPQPRDRGVLERRLRELDAGALLRGAPGHGNARRRRPGHARRHRRRHPPEVLRRFAVGADGASSTVRPLLGVPAAGRLYPDHYLMGDFPDSSPLRQDAALFLESGGIVESFPLPGGVRRWVVRLARPPDRPDPGAAGRPRGPPEPAWSWTPAATPCSAASVSGPGWRPRMVAGRTALIGDAAHEISPIGGQGMNLGWLDAESLLPASWRCCTAGHPGRTLFAGSMRRGAGPPPARNARLR